MNPVSEAETLVPLLLRAGFVLLLMRRHAHSTHKPERKNGSRLAADDQKYIGEVEVTCARMHNTGIPKFPFSATTHETPHGPPLDGLMHDSK
jgi:hypothetical protein